MSKTRGVSTKTILLVVILSSLVLQGCFFRFSRKNEDRLNQRMTKYWDARLNNDYETAYEMETKKTRMRIEFPTYFGKMHNSTSELLEYTFDLIEYDEQRDEYFVKVKKLLEVVVPQLGSKIKLNNVQPEIWKFENGDWYREYIDPNKAAKRQKKRAAAKAKVEAEAAANTDATAQEKPETK